MERVNHVTALPNQNGAGKAGFTGGSSSQQIPPTVVPPAWLNAVQEEVALTVEGAGIALVPGTNTQLLAAVQKLIGKAWARASLSGSAVTPTNPFTISGLNASAGFSVVSNAIEVPVAGTYLVCASYEATSSLVANPSYVNARVSTADVAFSTYMVGPRYTANAADPIYAATTALFVIATPASQRIGVSNQGGGNVTLSGSGTISQISLVRVA